MTVNCYMYLSFSLLYFINMSMVNVFMYKKTITYLKTTEAATRGVL